MYDQVAPVYWIMKQVIKVTDVQPSILPGPLYNAAIRLLCPNLAHQMASFMVNWHCAVYRAKIEEHFTSSTFRVTQLIWQWHWQHEMYFLNLHLSFLHPSNYLLSHGNHARFWCQVPRVVFRYRINKIIYVLTLKMYHLSWLLIHDKNTGVSDNIWHFLQQLLTIKK